MSFSYYNITPLILSRYADELSPLPAPIRGAELFRHTVEDMPLSILPDDLIPGWYGFETRPELPDPIPQLPFQSFFTEEQARIRRELHQNFQMRGSYSTGHTCIDYGRIVSCGMEDVLRQVQTEAAKPELSEEKQIMLNAMERSILAVGIYSRRYRELAMQMAQNADSESNRNRLLRMANALERVPMQPAENFYEGVVAVWLMHVLIAIADQSWASISLGLMDQYLYPLYCKSLQSGVSRDDCKNVLKNLFLLLDSYGDGACALNIGGLSADGHDQMNDLSELLIEVEKEMRLRSPILVVRVHPDMPQSILDSVIDLSLFQIGQPTFYGELPCREAVRLRGIDPQEASTFSVNSCMGLVIAGREIADMWGCVINMHLPLELAVNAGKPFFGEMPFSLKTPPLAEIHSTEELLQQYEKYLFEILPVVFANNFRTAQEAAQNSPDPLLSALTDGCIERGLDRAIGAFYNTITVECMGTINTGDAIRAIEQLVFQQHAYTLPQLMEAVKTNFEHSPEIHAALRKCDKYGAGIREVDSICARLGNMMADFCESHSFANFRYLPSLHTIDANIGHGAALGAMLDGRKAGEPVNKNANPTVDALTANPTGHILSAASFPQNRYSGGQPIDLYFDRNNLSTPEQRAKIRQLILTYFDLGGLQFQVNSIDPDILQKAFDAPEQYPHLIVRIGGYSARFVELGRGTQLDLIQRFRAASAS